MTEYIVSLPESFECNLRKDSVRKNRKINSYTDSLILLAVNEHGAIQTLIDARFYQTANRSYCCVWINVSDYSLIGGAYAGGYGYHKQSASLEFALNDAGINTAGLEGRGDSPMISCLEELGNKLNDELNLNMTGLTVIKAHA